MVQPNTQSPIWHYAITIKTEYDVASLWTLTKKLEQVASLLYILQVNKISQIDPEKIQSISFQEESQ